MIVIETKRLLCVGAGGSRVSVRDCETVTIDIDPKMRPDVVADMCDLSEIESGSFDFLVARHCLEHVSYPRGQMAIAEWFRVLVPGGRIHVAVPDVLAVVKGCRSLADKVYDSPAGPIHVCDMIYGWRSSSGTPTTMRHWAAYDGHMLGRLLGDAGFTDIQVRQANYEIAVEAVHPCNAITT